MKIEFKTIEFDNRFLDEDALSLIQIDPDVISIRTDEYKYLKNPNMYYTDSQLRKDNLDDMFGAMNVLIFADGVEVGSMDCFDFKNKFLFIDKIETIDKGKGYGTLILTELKKHFKTIKIEQAIPSAIHFYEKNGFLSESLYSANKYQTLIYEQN